MRARIIAAILSVYRWPRETSSPAAGPRANGFRSQPYDDVLLTEREA